MMQTAELSTPISASHAASRTRLLTSCLLLALVTAALYWPVVKNGFINFDDPDYVTSNPLVQKGLSWQGVRWAFTSYHSSNWHPITWLSHMLDCQLYGLKPTGHHLTNVAIHILNTLLLFGLLNRLTDAFWRSAIVAGLFALHPLHVESVAWISERKDVLSALFFILALWAYARYATPLPTGLLDRHIPDPAPRTSPHVSRSTRHKWLWYILALFFFTLGLMSKPMLVTLPFVLLLVDFWPLGRFQIKTEGSKLKALSPLLLEKIPFFALTTASCTVTFLVQRNSGAVASISTDSIASRMADGAVAYGAYVVKTFWPLNLSVIYPYPRTAWGPSYVLGSCLIVLLITALVVFAVRKHRVIDAPRTLPPSHPAFAVGWLWFLGMLIPVIGLVRIGKQFMADRYTYLPHIGLFIMLVWGVAEAFLLLQRKRMPQHPAPSAHASRTDARVASHPSSGQQSNNPTLSLFSFLAPAFALVACMFLTSRQLSFWKNDHTLFEHAAAVTRDNYVAYGALANVLFAEKKFPEAAKLCGKALTIFPSYPEALYSLGCVYAAQRQFDQALATYRAALQADPTYGEAYASIGAVLNQQHLYSQAEIQCRQALRWNPLQTSAFFNLATALHNQGKLDEAAAYYRRVLELDPSLSTAHRYWGNVLLAQGKSEEAITHFLEALKFQSDDVGTHVALGLALLGQDRLDDAADHFLQACQLQPTNAVANYQLALIRQTQGQTRQAIDHYHKALDAQPDWPEALNNLAWLLAASADATLRNGTEAVRRAERACKLSAEREPLFLGTLAAAYAEAGRFTDAIATAERARDLATAADQKELAEKNRELLQLYRTGVPYHESK
jgi:tetratricopeptide (TPR) repeat protein